MNAHTTLFGLILILALPLLSALVAILIPLKFRKSVAAICVGIHLIVFVLVCLLIFQVWNEEMRIWTTDWFTLGNITWQAGLLLNNVTLVMLLIVSSISSAVHVFSSSYMHDDDRLKQYFTGLGFFTFSMLGLILSENLFLLFICWELVGFCSYLLIGHWRDKPLAAIAAKKAFIINRVADLGVITGLLILYTQTNSLSLSILQIPENDFWRTFASLSLIFGVLGKSAQLPFYNWLPSAMEGPTPVSALIHAATMVVAGVFLLIRVFPLFDSLTLDIITIIGCTTALLGSVVAIRQYDIKKILAYSTISQLGLMVAAVGTGHYGIALLHLFTHAFFKAGLFLGAGAIIHAVHEAQHKAHFDFNVQDIRNLGGLRKFMPITFICFSIFCAALMGLPLLSGFQSKDAILIHLLNWGSHDWKIVFIILIIISFTLTIIYTIRMLFYTFFATPQKTAKLEVKEVNYSMLIPILLLAVCSFFFIVSRHPLSFSGWLLAGISVKTTHNLFITWLSMIIIPSVVVLTLLYYRRKELAKEKSIQVLEAGFYFDAMNEVLIRKPVIFISIIVERFDKKIIDRVLHAIAYMNVTFAHFLGWIDSNVVDGGVQAIAWTAKRTGTLAKSFSGGKIQTYILLTSITLIIFLFWILF